MACMIFMIGFRIQNVLEQSGRRSGQSNSETIPDVVSQNGHFYNLITWTSINRDCPNYYGPYG